MALQAPDLDTRSFDQIFEGARLRIPRYAPEWTDFNDSDPGIALLQLFAWLTEMQLYALNRVPERSYIKFLQLLGLELEPAQPARAHLTFAATAGTRPDPIPARTQVSAAPPEGGPPLVFETEAGLDLVSVPLTDVRVYDGSTFADVSAANATPGPTYWPLGFVPQPGAALYLGFSQTDPPAPEPAFPQEIRLRVFRPVVAQAGAPQRADEAESPPAPPVTLAWEYKPAADAPAWRRLQVYEDESAAFTRDEGYVLLEGPRAIEPAVEAGLEDARFWLRCRLVAGAYPAGHEPEIDFVRPNTVPAENVSTVRDEVLGQAEGHPGERFSIRRTPVQAATLRIELQVPGQPAESWEAVEDFLASGRDDRHYVLNPTSGEVRFGDGSRGLIPPAGADVVAAEYRYGGGDAGNVGAGLINAPLGALPGVDGVTNERPAEGGRDEQTVEELKQAAPAVLRHRNRAVTAADFTALAERAGGVAKATAVALAHPDHPGIAVPGAVTVAVVPDAEDRPPEPSPGLIEQVCRYLNGYRLLTTELFVKGPVYRAVTVQARVAAEPYAAFDAVAQDAKKAIDAFLDPRAWDFGRDLYPTSLFSVIMGVAHVSAVRTLQVLVDRRPWEMSQPLVLPPDGLVYGSADHDIVVEPFRDQ